MTEPSITIESPTRAGPTEKAAGEPIPFDDVDLYAEMVDGALDAAADAAARPAENIAAILDRHETPDRAEHRNRKEQTS